VDVHLIRRRILIIVAKQAEQWGIEILGVVDRGNRPGRAQLILGHDNAAAPQIHHRVESVDPAGHQDCVSPPRA
jgi:hypothetical protein